METYILGISAYFHDSAAALIRNGEIIAAAQEERFTRKKQDNRFPENAVKFCLNKANIEMEQVSTVVFYDKPFLKLDRIIKTYLSLAPRGFNTFVSDMPHWLTDKIHLKRELIKKIKALSNSTANSYPKLVFTEHHHSHAASAFYASPYVKAAVLSIDGVGEWATTSVWQGEGNILNPIWQINFPHSLGLLYSAFTYFCGFKVDSGEYKVMGLAPYGRPIYRDIIFDRLIDLKSDGTFHLDMEYFDFATGRAMTTKKFDKLFGDCPRTPESNITQRELDLAASIQVVTEEVVLALARTIHHETGNEYLCLAGGVALNCVANGRLLREGPFKDIWIQPAAGDAGGALGAAFIEWYEHMKQPRKRPTQDAMAGSYLGTSYSNDEIKVYLDSINADYKYIEDDHCLSSEVACILNQNMIVGWFQGRMEFGPRALGSRSIVGNPCSNEMQSIMNLKIKYRESFRPFAPAILAEKASQWFELDRSSPYMLLVAPLLEQHKKATTKQEDSLFGIDKLKVQRSAIPAVTHVDYSARIQTVHKESNPKFHQLISDFEKLTNCPMLINTSFNVRGEPIVESPMNAYQCFMRTKMDFLVLGNFILAKKNQPIWHESADWLNEFELD